MANANWFKVGDRETRDIFPTSGRSRRTSLMRLLTSIRAGADTTPKT